MAAKLRPGIVHSADDGEELLLPEIDRQQRLGNEVVFRADAASAKPERYEALEERGVRYTPSGSWPTTALRGTSRNC